MAGVVPSTSIMTCIHSLITMITVIRLRSILSSIIPSTVIIVWLHIIVIPFAVHDGIIVSSVAIWFPITLIQIRSILFLVTTVVHEIIMEGITETVWIDGLEVGTGLCMCAIIKASFLCLWHIFKKAIVVHYSLVFLIYY